ncbi:E3 ubiquitin-protein ligase TRIM39-like [Triplophysa dalaica]|uniref:E3 ubiquitin-protein ligase TRIM39-like n=1 Tax=Triplophysa dalaica TaxID=1582913 RepID=UPI0024DFE102|nr:E3 ubiquitin-protein ligase TRIM39-like [Triplophysa dalaica]XP_056596870.1 E3 ubiquitin-protein ligase TRIM39-like [Triplophysa dalaica]
MMSSSSDPMTERLLCSICLEVFSDPVSTPCGHNFCKICLNTYWNNSEDYRCPNCKETFKQRPDLKINTTLRDVVDEHKKKSPEEQPEAEVVCDICTEGKLKAVKSCLVCQISYCETHLESHLRVSGLQKHKLIDPVKNLQDYICQKHDRPLELLCRDDHTCVCLICTVTDHKNHNFVSVKDEGEERKIQILKTQTDVQQMIQDRIKKTEDIKHSAELRRRNTEKEKAASVAVFSDLMSSIERCQSELLEMMEEKQKAAEKHDEDVIKDLEQEITELKKRNIELEQISHTEHHLQLIQIHSSICSPLNTKNCPEISLKSHVSVEKVRRSLTQLQENLQEKLSEAVLKWMQQYAVDVTLDPDTAHPNLILSDDEKYVRHGDISHKLPDNPKRFDRYAIVLGKEGFSSGRFYYEVQVKGKTDWQLGVAIESVNRKGDITLTPVNGFWTLLLRNENKYAAVSDPSVSLSVNPQKVGVFVDYEEGLVSFYDVENRSHIYSYTDQSFTEKLYPYFSPCLNDEGKNSEPLIITPVN